MTKSRIDPNIAGKTFMLPLRLPVSVHHPSRSPLMPVFESINSRSTTTKISSRGFRQIAPFFPYVPHFALHLLLRFLSSPFSFFFFFLQGIITALLRNCVCVGGGRSKAQVVFLFSKSEDVPKRAAMGCEGFP